MMAFLMLVAVIKSYANPGGGVVTQGQAQIIQEAGLTTIQQDSLRAVIEWQNFSINPGELTQFLQSGGNAVVLNKVVSNLPSHILGDLKANGKVFLVNPNGVVIGNGASINTRTFLATTLNIQSDDFMNGGDIALSGTSNAAIVNLGSITADGGDIYLVARKISNEGLIKAEMGEVGLAAGTEVLLSQESKNGSRIIVKANKFAEDLVDFSEDFAIDNSGIIEASQVKLEAMNGNIYKLAINNDGIIKAKGITMNPDGSIRLVAHTGKVRHAGIAAAHNFDGGGGHIDILGDKIILENNAQINASAIPVPGQKPAQLNGGSIRIGGDFQGRGDVQRAQSVHVDETVVITADAHENGDGGRVIVWSDDKMAFAGNISARGGTNSGDGGFAEVSGKVTLDYSGYTDLSTENGETGTLLLDPTDYIINDAERDTIEAQLAGANVIISTAAAGGGDGDITVNSAIDLTTNNSLSLLAHGNLEINNVIALDGSGDLTLVAGWDGSTGWGGASGIQTGAGFDFSLIAADINSYGNNAGSIYIGDGTQTGGIAVGSRNGATTLAGSRLVLEAGTAGNTYAQVGWTKTSTTDLNNSEINIYMDNDITASAGSGTGAYVQIGHGGNGRNIAGDEGYKGTINIHRAGDINFTAGTSSNAYAQIGFGGRSASDNHAGDINIISAGDLTFSGGSTTNTYAHLGNGGSHADGDLTGDISITQAGDIEFSAGGGKFSGAQLGHGGYHADGDKNGDIVIGTVQDITFTSENSGQYSHAQLGHGGSDTWRVGTDMIGDISIGQAGDLTLISGTGWKMYTMLGHGGSERDGLKSGDISIGTVGDITVTALSQNGWRGHAQIGHGGYDANGDVTGDITISQAADIVLGAQGAGSKYTQIGHGGRIVDGDISGAVTINADSLLLSGGGNGSNYAMVGNGATSTQAGSGNRTGDVTIDVSGEISLVKNDAGLYIGNMTSDENAFVGANAVSVSAAALDYSASDTGTYIIDDDNFTNNIETVLANGIFTLTSTDAPLVIGTNINAGAYESNLHLNAPSVSYENNSFQLLDAIVNGKPSLFYNVEELENAGMLNQIKRIVARFGNEIVDNNQGFTFKIPEATGLNQDNTPQPSLHKNFEGGSSLLFQDREELD